MAIERWSPFREMTPLREIMDRLFEESFVSPRRLLERDGWLGIDVSEQNDQYQLGVALPGVKPENVDISVSGNTVTLSGEIPCPETKEGGPTYLLHELPCGKFRRTVTLPMEVDADKAQAVHEHGLLRLTLPKAAAARAKRIQVTAGGGKR